MKSNNHTLAVVAVVHLRCRFALLLNCCFLLSVLRSEYNSLSLLRLCQNRTRLNFHGSAKAFLNTVKLENNIRFTLFVLTIQTIVTLSTWLMILLLMCGDVHPNPGPEFSPNSSISSCSVSTIDIASSLSLVHYNVQSILSKIDILTTELQVFDIMAFTETWLGEATQSEELEIPTFHPPERKDRKSDNHGGVIIYVKNNIFYKRRKDLEINDLESLWIELILSNNKHILVGVLYRPPNANAAYFKLIEDSIHLAVDTGIEDIVLTGDLNFNMFNSATSRKVSTICEQFGLEQIINEATHFTEHSNSLIDLILVKNKDSILSSGVGDPFLQQAIRYHCPTFALFNIRKPKLKTYTRKIYKYDQGNYDLLRQKARDIDWNEIKEL